MNVLHLVNVYTDVTQNPKATNPLHELFFFQLMDWATQNMNLDSTTVRTDQMLNDRWILKSLVLQP